MSWLENIRKKSNEEKIHLLWTILGTTLVILIIFWLIVGNYRYNGGTVISTITKDFQNYKAKK